MRLQWIREDITEEKKNTYESFRKKKERAIIVGKRERESEHSSGKHVLYFIKNN